MCCVYNGKALEMDEFYGITQGHFEDMRTGVLNVRSLYQTSFLESLIKDNTDQSLGK